MYVHAFILLRLTLGQVIARLCDCAVITLPLPYKVNDSA